MKNDNNLEIENHILPGECTNRNIGLQIPKFVVIHEVSLGTEETPKDRNMEYYEKLILEQGRSGRTIGYHYLCGDNKVYQFIPDNEIAHHTGTEINNCSIGIERLVCEGLDTNEAIHNQAKLAATLLVKYDLSPSKLITHQDTRIMTGRENKECPGRLLAGKYGGMKRFRDEVKQCLKDKDLFFDMLVDSYVLINAKALFLSRKNKK